MMAFVAAIGADEVGIWGGRAVEKDAEHR